MAGVRLLVPSTERGIRRAVASVTDRCHPITNIHWPQTLGAATTPATKHVRHVRAKTTDADLARERMRHATAAKV